jgi:hypothetical protein
MRDRKGRCGIMGSIEFIHIGAEGIEHVGHLDLTDATTFGRPWIETDIAEVDADAALAAEVSPEAYAELGKL